MMRSQFPLHPFRLQLLAVFMQMGARELLMHYMDLKQTNDVQLTFEALKVTAHFLLLACVLPTDF